MLGRCPRIILPLGILLSTASNPVTVIGLYEAKNDGLSFHIMI